MTSLDWLVVAGYFLLIFLVSIWGILRSKDTTSDYFLAGHSLGRYVVAASIFASNIGSEHLVGLAGSGATDGVAMAHYELHAWCLLVLGWLLIPFYLRGRVFTMPEFLEKRFSPAARYLLSITSLFMYIVTKIAVGIFAGGVVFSVLLPELTILGFDSFWVGSVTVLVFTGLYTTLGGFRVVAYTETIQTAVLILGSSLVTYFGLQTLGGWSELRALLDSDMFNLWKPLVPEGIEGSWFPVEEFNSEGTLIRQAWYFNSNYPWLGMLFCAPIIGLWYWCTDQYIVQRALGARNIDEARSGTILAALLKLSPLFIFILPGMICYALILKGQNGAVSGLDFQPMLSGDGKNIAESGMAFPLMVKNVLPAGIRGLVTAGLLSALMSSLAGVFNASSTLFTIDLFSKWRPRATQETLVRVGRIATIAMVLIALAWIPVIKGSRGLYDYLQSVQGYLAPPIFVVFFFGIFWKRLNAAGCLAALCLGGALGIFRLAVDTPAKIDPHFSYLQGSFFWIVNKIYFQYFSVLIFLFSAAAMVIISLLTSPPDYEKIKGLAFGTAASDLKQKSSLPSRRGDLFLSGLVLLLILYIYLSFNG